MKPGKHCSHFESERSRKVCNFEKPARQALHQNGPRNICFWRDGLHDVRHGQSVCKVGQKIDFASVNFSAWADFKDEVISIGLGDFIDDRNHRIFMIDA